MAVGINPVVANGLLAAIFTGVAFTGYSQSWIQLHTDAGDPGVNGTANISSYATRTQITTWAASAVNGVLAITATVPITNSWNGTNGENIFYVSYWSAVTGGTFIISDQLPAKIPMATGAPLTLQNLTAPFLNQAA